MAEKWPEPRREYILSAAWDVGEGLVAYPGDQHEMLEAGDVSELVRAGVVTVPEIVSKFRQGLIDCLSRSGAYVESGENSD